MSAISSLGAGAAGQASAQTASTTAVEALAYLTSDVWATYHRVVAPNGRLVPVKSPELVQVVFREENDWDNYSRYEERTYDNSTRVWTDDLLYSPQFLDASSDSRTWRAVPLFDYSYFGLQLKNDVWMSAERARRLDYAGRVIAKKGGCKLDCTIL